MRYTRSSPFVPLLVLLASASFATEAGGQAFGTPRIRYDIHGNILMTGNTSHTCRTGTSYTSGGTTLSCEDARESRTSGLAIDGNYVMDLIDADPPSLPGSGTTTMASGASLSLPPTALVKRAYLYWTCISDDPARNTVGFQTPSSDGYVPTTADTVHALFGGAYLGVADVTTAIVTGGAGDYWVGNMKCLAGVVNAWGGWTLVVVYEDVSEPLRDLVIWDGLQAYATGAITLNLSGFVTPYDSLVSITTDVGVFSSDGDMNQPDSVQLIAGALTTDLVDPIGGTATDFANSTIATPYLPTQTRTPSYANTLGLDLDVVRLTDRIPHGATDASLRLQGSADEVLWTGVVTFATEIYAPDLVSTKTAVDLDGGQLQPGDSIEYTIAVRNEGLDAATSTSFTDVLPSQTRLSEATDAIRLDGSILSPTADSDAASYDSATNTVTVGIGDASGRVAPGETAILVLKVIVAAGVPSGTAISNQGTFSYRGETLGSSSSFTSYTDGTSTSNGSEPTVTVVGLESPTLVSPAPNAVVPIASPTFSGSAAPGSSVTVLEGATEICTATTDASGAWSCSPTTPLTEGDHILDLVSELGAATSTGGPETITVDLTAPVVVILVPTNGSTLTTTSPTITGTSEPFATIVVREGPTPICITVTDATGTWACAPASPLADGAHSVLATATDAAGNASSPDATTFTIDSTGPAAPVIVTPTEGAVLGDTTPTIAGTSEPNASIVVTEGGATICTATTDGSGAWSCVPSAALSFGPHTITATASDAVGNLGGSDTQSFMVLLGALSTPGLTSPLVPVADATPDLVGTADPGSTVTVRDDQSTVVCIAVTNASGIWTCTPTTALDEGPNPLTLVATDGPATSSPGTATVTVDSTPPPPPIFTMPGVNPVGTTQPVIGGTAEPGSTVTVTGPNGPVCTAVTDASGHWSCAPTTALPEGPTVVHATTTDGTGNTSGPATTTITVDTTAPSIGLTVPANGATITDPRPTVGGNTEPFATVVVTEPGGSTVCTATADASGAWSCVVPSDLVDGPHSLTAIATDAAGNSSTPATTGFVVDTTEPEPAPEPTTGGLSGGALCTVGHDARGAMHPSFVMFAVCIVAVSRRRRRR